MLKKKSINSLFEVVNSFNEIKNQIDRVEADRPSSPVAIDGIWTLEGQIMGNIHINETLIKDQNSVNDEELGGTYRKKSIFQETPLLIILVLSLAYSN